MLEGSYFEIQSTESLSWSAQLDYISNERFSSLFYKATELSDLKKLKEYLLLFYCFFTGFITAIFTVPQESQLGQVFIIFSSFFGIYQHLTQRTRYFFHLIPQALHRCVPSSASLQRGVLLVPQDAHSFST